MGKKYDNFKKELLNELKALIDNKELKATDNIELCDDINVFPFGDLNMLCKKGNAYYIYSEFDVDTIIDIDTLTVDELDAILDRFEIEGYYIKRGVC